MSWLSSIRSIASARLDAMRIGRARRALAARAGRTGAAPLGDRGSLPAHVDAARTIDGRQILLRGWAEDVWRGDLYLHAGPGEPVRLNVISWSRPDVSAHLRGSGRAVASDRHAFVASAAVAEAPSQARLSLVMGDAAAISPTLALGTTVAPTRELLALAADGAREAGTSLAATLQTLVVPILPAPPGPPDVAAVRRYGPAADGTPRASIIVPFYGDAFHLRDHLAAQRRAPDDVEWILVCDDVDLAGPMGNALDWQRSLLRQPTILLVLSRNGGYAHANNLGAAHARGRYLVLMNSDVLCDTFEFLDRGVAALEAEPKIAAAGFPMAFEDGTAQHDGIVFERAAWFDGLWASQHPGKGLPPARPAASVRDVDAVTAALMLLRRGDFPDGRLFDPGYVVGDFEDADLCLRLGQEGRRVVLVDAPGLWHLERQSMRHAGDAGAREAQTTLNAIRFNARWGAVLAGDAGAPRP